MKDFIEKYKELKSTTRGKAILFFGFYLTFFLILTLFFRLSSNLSLPSATEYEKGVDTYKFYMEKIGNNNYSFTYEIKLDGVSYLYSGKKYENREIIRFKDKNYYRDGEDFYIQNNTWIAAKSPYIFSEFLDAHNIGELIVLGSYEAKTKYKDERQDFNFLISTNTINQKLKNINSDFFEEPNKMIIGSDKDEYVDQITLDLDSYCTLNKLCKNSLQIKLKYSDFGEIEKIDDPTK